MKKTLLTTALILASTISIAYAMCEKANIAKPVYSTNSLEVYFLEPFDKNQKTEAVKRLNQLIKESQNRIHFAVYGISNQQVKKNLINKYKNGCDVKWVTDINKFGVNNYSGTEELQAKLPTYKLDDANAKLELDTKQEADFKIKDKVVKTQFDDTDIKYFTDQLMHNKFFVFDNDTVSTGSVNISHSGIGGGKYINANDFLVIKSQKINEIYAKEFAQMYDGKFHKEKQAIQNKKNIVLEDGSKVSVYFAPIDNYFLDDVIAKINESKEYVYMPIFYLTDRRITQALINAKERGVDVKVLLDASSAASKYTKHKVLRLAGVPVKVENWAGKMHMKCLVTEKYVITGSLNWTSRAQNYNDENSLIIENPQLASVYRNHFIKLYDSIPDIWLTKDPKPEGLDTPNSCSDGLDNDHDGYTDRDDWDCNPKAKQGKLYQDYYKKLK